MKSLLLLLCLTPACAYAQEPVAPSSGKENPAPTASTGLDTTAKVFQIITGVGTLFVLFSSMRVSMRLKRSDILENEHRRWDGIVEALAKLTPKSATNAASQIYYKRFWNLQYDQFKNWQASLIPDDIYQEWMQARREEWNDNLPVEDVSYQQGWEHVRSQYSGKSQNKAFDTFMAEILKTKRDISAIMRQFAPSGWTRFLREIGW